MLSIHNSLTGKVEAFQPIVAGKVRMYVCGITVYDYCHVGHGRMMVAFDVVQRWLRYSGHDVTYVRNITDIDDKIIRRAAENGETIGTLTARFIGAMDEDLAALGVARPEHEPRATAHIPHILALIEKLIARGHAYVAADGDVMYAVASFAGYGRLSGKKLEDLRAGARVEVDAAKRDPLDFVLWKRAKPGEPAWDSPWGQGRPGWHIECSAMSMALLGEHFDIHGGGMDLKFPHHENEIAQSCGAGAHFANVWMHNGFVNVDSEKMSKSLGNFFTLREVLPQLRHPEVLRYFLIASHYRGPINYTLDNLRQADATLGGLYNALRGVAAGEAGPDAVQWRGEFRAAMDDDFNTPKALAVLQRLARDINEAKAGTCFARAAELGAVFRELAAPLGICRLEPEQWFRLPVPGGAGKDSLDDAAIDAAIAARLAARKGRNFQEADRLRDELLAAGVLLEDGPAGTSWRRR
jgi:cysteinyl-tRNA synthetase